MVNRTSTTRAPWLLTLLAVLLGAAAVRALRGGRNAVLEQDGHWNGGRDWPALTPNEVVDDVTDPEVIDLTIGGATSTKGDTGSEGARWVEAVAGTCPTGYPVKAKLRSGIFHQPGGLSYDRTAPDRCYVDSASAEADGLRAAKR